MEQIYEKKMKIPDIGVDCFGRMKASWLLACLQEVAGEHVERLGGGSPEHDGHRLFWAVTRHRIQITRLPQAGETIVMRTWPCATTRVAYPRATVAFDETGRELFRGMSLWVLMDARSRAMILPGKSGIFVDGITTGDEIAFPASLPPTIGEHTAQRNVAYTELDINGHMNNTQYLNWVEDLLPSAFHQSHPAREFTICYLSEARENDRLELHWTLDDALHVDALCQDPAAPEKMHRVFAASVLY